MTKIGEKIKEARLQNGWSQEELAKKMGYKSKSTINKIELGKNDVSQSKAVKFAEILNVPLSYLLGWTETEITAPLLKEWRNPKTADAISEILTNERLLKHIHLLVQLSDDKMNQIYDQIQYWYDKENAD